MSAPLTIDTVGVGGCGSGVVVFLHEVADNSTTRKKNKENDSNPFKNGFFILPSLSTKGIKKAAP